MIELVDEEGTSHEFTVHDIVESEGKSYAILEPVNGEPGQGVAMRLEQDPDGNDVLIPVTDDQELSRLISILEEGTEDD